MSKGLCGKPVLSFSSSLELLREGVQIGQMATGRWQYPQTSAETAERCRSSWVLTPSLLNVQIKIELEANSELTRSLVDIMSYGSRFTAELTCCLVELNSS